MNTKLLVFAIIPALLFGMASVYAEQQVLVELPFDRPFVDTQCITVPQEALGYVLFDCSWRWTLSDGGWEQVPNFEETGEDYRVWIKDNISIIENNPLIEQEEEPATDPETGELVDDPPMEQTPEQEERAILLEELDKCRYGLENEFSAAFGAFQQDSEIESYENKTRGNFEARDNLKSDRSTLAIIKAIEACDIMLDAIRDGIVGEREANMAMADLLGEDTYGRNQTNFGLDPTRHTTGFDITEDHLKNAADGAKEWMCAPEQAHLKLCNAYQPLQGENRGGQPEGAKCQTKGQPATLGGTPAQERCPLEARDALEAEEPTLEDVWKRIYKGQCDEHMKHWETVEDEDRPEWTKYCEP